ncbi:type 1 glutamine amidotransferase domain-containing protein [Neisseria sp.]|uniref:type 1 glutamine amidotransferase domain-containing protein n=1 Tax=Neisseria sp. TaxID=192066 RepID=UPI0026DAC5FA|nr:type 1 glutamine amidotransferase domain-containing protein [Neisseria sp.]MDO4907780.1 type 1 glutamine amidotransferase domain-containing protein [Neisseria sp.]
MLKKLSVIALGAVLGLSQTAFADTAKTQNPPKGKILLVASSVNEMKFKDGRPHKTGYYLGELAVPAQEFIKAGYQVDVATPDGTTPALDKNSINVELFQNDPAKLSQAMAFVLSHPTMQRPFKLKEIARSVQALSQYDAVYVPGGHAPMVDLVQDKDLGRVLKHFHENGKTTALLCHGPIALASAVNNPAAFRKAMVRGDHAKARSLAKNWIYKDYKMNVYSTAEEHGVENWLGAKIEFYMEDALRNAGGNVIVGEADKPFIMQDRELITGQNPFSDHLLAEAVLKRLAQQKSGR